MATANLLDATIGGATTNNLVVLLLGPQGKEPLTPHGLTDACKDTDTISKWWQRNSEANVGIRTGLPSGLVTIDVDCRHDGRRTLGWLKKNHDSLPYTPPVLTGGGGFHILLLPPG